MEFHYLQPYDMTSQHPVSAYKYIHTSYLYLSHHVAVLLEWRASFPWHASFICHRILGLCFHDDLWSWWLPSIIIVIREVFPGASTPRALTMFLSWCYNIHCFLSYYFTTNRNHLKDKMISIVVEIPHFFFFRFLFIRFFSYIWDMGFSLFPLPF